MVCDTCLKTLRADGTGHDEGCPEMDEGNLAEYRRGYYDQPLIEKTEPPTDASPAYALGWKNKVNNYPPPPP